MDLGSLSRLQTEGINPRTVTIDQVSTLELCTLINRDDYLVAESVTPFLPQIADAIDDLAPRVRRGGRVIYVGAGTSGRLGILDASEIPPTFAAPFSQFVGIIAGGDAAIRKAQEGAEDSVSAGEQDLEALELDPELDSVIGIAASGRTPYVLGCMNFAKRLGCLTIGVVCASPSAMSRAGTVDHMLSPLPGPECVTGSTRLKAGTATKLVLNMLSTGTMIRIGKTYGNMMVDLVASNNKLKQRSRNILRKLSPRCDNMTDEQLDDLLAQCDRSVKLALMTANTGLSVEQSRRKLESAGGILAQALKAANKSCGGNQPNESAAPDRRFILCIDGGGSKCAAVITDEEGDILGRGLAGPCNLTDGHGMGDVIATLEAAAKNAMKNVPTHILGDDTPLDGCFRTVWLGLAGIDRSGFREALLPDVSALFGVAAPDNLRLTNDVDLLAAAMSRHPGSESAIVLIAGTGSVAMRYHWTSGLPVRVARSGGWGHILGDEGGGYAIGLRAIKHTVARLENARLGLGGADSTLGVLEQAVLQRLRCGQSPSGEYDLVGEVLVPQQQATKTRIAGVAEAVLGLAGTDDTATRIIHDQVDDLVNTTLGRLLHPKCQGYHPSAGTGLILSGGVVSHATYQKLLMERLSSRGIQFAYVERVHDAVSLGATSLAMSHQTET